MSCVFCNRTSDCIKRPCCNKNVCTYCYNQNHSDLKCSCIEDICPACFNICHRCNKIATNIEHKPECVYKKVLLLNTCCRKPTCGDCAILFKFDGKLWFKQKEREISPNSHSYCFDHIYVCKYCRHLTRDQHNICDVCKYIRTEVSNSMKDIITHNLEDFEKNTKDYLVGIMEDLHINPQVLDSNFYERILKDMKQVITREMIQLAGR
jgi:hypothetical protein